MQDKMSVIGIDEIVLPAGSLNAPNGLDISCDRLSHPLTISGSTANNVRLTSLTSQKTVTQISNNGSCVELGYTGTNFPILYVNGERRTLACSEAYRLKADANAMTASSDHVLQSDFILNLNNWRNTDNPEAIDTLKNNIQTGSILCIHCYWFHLRMQVVQVVDNSVIKLRYSASFNCQKYIIKDKCYYIQLLNTNGTSLGEGEYNYDSQKIKYKPVSDDTSTPSYTIGGSEHLLNLRGCHGITFKNICFCHNGVADITVGCSQYGQSEDLVQNAVNIQGSSHITFEGCEFHDLMGYAVGNSEYGSLSSQYICLNKCHIHDTDGGGIHLTASSHDNISDNIIENTGMTMRSSCAILIRNSHHDTIVNNLIQHCYYTGISLGWQWAYGNSESHDHYVARNKISHCMQGNLLEDGGGVYNLGESAGTVIEYNEICHLHECRDFMAAGIYLDQASSHVTVRNNLLYDNRVNIHINYGQDNTITNNLLAYPIDCGFLMNRQNGTGLTFTANLNVYIQEAGRPFRLPYNGLFAFSGDIINLSGADVMVASSHDWLLDSRTSGCSQVSGLENQGLFTRGQDNMWTFNGASVPLMTEAAWNSLLSGLRGCAQTVSQTVTPSNAIRLTNHFFHNKGSVRIQSREDIYVSIDRCYKYTKSNNPGQERNGCAGDSLLVEAGYDYIFIFNGFFDARMSFAGDGLSKLSLFDVTFAKSNYGAKYSKAEIYLSDLTKLSAVDRLYARNSLRGIENDNTTIDLTGFTNLWKLYLGGDTSYDPDQQINSVLLTDSQMSVLADVNLGVRNVPANLHKLTHCDNLYITNFASWQNLRNLALNDFPANQLSTIDIRNCLTADITPIVNLIMKSYNRTQVTLSNLLQSEYQMNPDLVYLELQGILEYQ